jgi:hypothetical protein
MARRQSVRHYFFYVALSPFGFAPEGLFCLPVDQRGK